MIELIKSNHGHNKITRALYCIVLVLVIMISGMAGCQTDNDNDTMEIRLAPIDEVDVRIAESYPPQVFVYILGGLADSCTSFHDLTTKRDGKTINIKVQTIRPKDAECAQVYGSFEKNVPLGSDFTSGETYTVKVNDKETTFTMQ